MLIQEIYEEIKHYRKIIKDRIESNIIKNTSEPLKSFIEALINRDIVHPLPENRLAGLITLFRILSLPNNYRIVRTYIQDRLESLYLTHILEYVGLRECYSIILNKSRILISIPEICLMSIDTYCMRKIDKILGELCTKTSKILDYDLEICDDYTSIRIMFQGYVRDMYCKPCRFIDITVKGLHDSSIISLRFLDDIGSRVRYVMSSLSTSSETRSGLLYYQIVQLS